MSDWSAHRAYFRGRKSVIAAVAIEDDHRSGGGAGKGVRHGEKSLAQQILATALVKLMVTGLRNVMLVGRSAPVDCTAHYHPR